MATRAEIAARKQALLTELREFHASGRAHSGSPVPPVRELSEKFNLSKRIVSQELEILVEPKACSTRCPTSAHFSGARATKRSSFICLCLPLGRREGDEALAFLQAGFEDRIAHSGGMPLAMPLDKVTDHATRGELPQLAGVFRAVSVFAPSLASAAVERARRDATGLF